MIQSGGSDGLLPAVHPPRIDLAVPGNAGGRSIRNFSSDIFKLLRLNFTEKKAALRVGFPDKISSGALPGFRPGGIALPYICITITTRQAGANNRNGSTSTLGNRSD